jgi:hypothetical protein
LFGRFLCGIGIGEADDGWRRLAQETWIADLDIKAAGTWRLMAGDDTISKVMLIRNTTMDGYR